MPDVIETLRHEHKQIDRDLEKLERMAGACPESRIMEDLERVLINHVSREDEQIYRPLKKLASLSRDAEAFLAKSRQDLENVKISALVFFEKYRDGADQSLCRDFKQDFERLSRKIRARIEMEDKELFPFLTNFWKTLY